MSASVKAEWPRKSVRLSGPKNTAPPIAMATASPRYMSVTDRRTLRTSSPRTTRSAIDRDVVCSSGRKRTTIAMNIAAHSAATSP